MYVALGLFLICAIGSDNLAIRCFRCIIRIIRIWRIRFSIRLRHLRSISYITKIVKD